MKRHSADPISAGFGLLFALVAILLMVASPGIGGLHPSRLWPVPLIGLGALVVLMAIRGARRPPSADDVTVPPGESEPGQTA